MLTMREITERTALKHRLYAHDLRSRDMRRRVVIARNEAMAGCVAAGFTLRQIAAFMGDRDPSAVCKAVHAFNAASEPATAEKSVNAA